MKIHLRTLMKGTLWEALGLLIAFLVFKEWTEIGLYFIIRILIYYPFHRIFKKIKFRKTIEIK